MDPYHMSQALLACSQNVPFPGGLALEGMARLILVITAFMTMKETEKQDRQRAERLLQRGVDISNLIRRHQEELRRDQASSSFIVRFISSIAAIDAFVSEIGRSGKARKGIRRYLAVGFSAAFSANQDSKQRFDEHSRELDSLHLDFQSHLVSNKAARGPHQLIKHPDIQLFWKYRLTNALEVSWNNFWPHFLDEYPLLKKIFLGKEGTQMTYSFESLASPTKKEIITPQEIDRVFQPMDESVERIVHDCLQIEHGLDGPTKLLDIETLGEVQDWRGCWVRDFNRGEMNIEIFVTKNHKVLGSGVDGIGRFTLEGEDLATGVYWKKQYINGYIVIYKGFKIGGSKIQGQWTIVTYDKELRGSFFLEKIQKGNHVYEPINLQIWNGLYVKFGRNHKMSTQIVFTHSCKIHGAGFDEIGHYTWFGTFDHFEKGYKAVRLTKQYYQAHSVKYNGIVREALSGELVMKGIWRIPNDCKGKFELRRKE